MQTLACLLPLSSDGSWKQRDSEAMLAKFPPNSVRRTVASTLEIPKPPEFNSNSVSFQAAIVITCQLNSFSVGRSRQQCGLTLSSVVEALEPIPTL